MVILFSGVDYFSRQETFLQNYFESEPPACAEMSFEVVVSFFLLFFFLVLALVTILFSGVVLF